MQLDIPYLKSSLSTYSRRCSCRTVASLLATLALPNAALTLLRPNRSMHSWALSSLAFMLQVEGRRRRADISIVYEDYINGVRLCIFSSLRRFDLTSTCCAPHCPSHLSNGLGCKHTVVLLDVCTATNHEEKQRHGVVSGSDVNSLCALHTLSRTLSLT